MFSTVHRHRILTTSRSPGRLALLVVIVVVASLRAIESDSIRAQLRLLRPDRIPENTMVEREYFDRYHIDFPGVAHWIGAIRSDTFLLAAHLVRSAYGNFNRFN